MAKTFEANDYCNGKFSLINHAIKGISARSAKPPSRAGTMDAMDADKAVGIAIEYSTKQGIPLDRWSFYVVGVNEKLAKADKHLPVKALKKAVKDGWEATVEMGKYSHPRITLRDPEQPVQARVSRTQIIA